MTRSGLCALGFMVVAILVPFEQGNAQTVTTNIPVSARVVAGCSISGTGLDFGTFAGSDLTGTGTLTVTCSQSRSYFVTLNAGSNFGGVRQLKDPSILTETVLIPYVLFKDAAMTQQWGDSDFANTYPPGSSVAGTGSGAAQTLTIFGKVPADQLVNRRSGTYIDTVIATLLF